MNPAHLAVLRHVAANGPIGCLAIMEGIGLTRGMVYPFLYKARCYGNGKGWIDNEKVDVYEDGSFHAVIRLRKEGENIVEFLAQDAAGNEQVLKRPVYVETY